MILLAYCILMILINYITRYGFSGNSDELMISVQVLNSFLLPLLLSYHSYSATKTFGGKSFALQGCFIIIFYLSTYIVPSLNYFSLKTFSFACDGHTKALFTIIIEFGLAISFISITVFQYLLLRRARNAINSQ